MIGRMKEFDLIYLSFINWFSNTCTHQKCASIECFLFNLLRFATFFDMLSCRESTSSSSSLSLDTFVYPYTSLSLLCFLFLPMLLIRHRHRRIKITQAYNLKHLIDYLVLLFRLHLNWISIWFVRSFVYLSSFIIDISKQKKKNWSLSFSICSWSNRRKRKAIIKRLHILCNYPLVNEFCLLQSRSKGHFVQVC